VAYSASGEASGPVVYVNYGLPPDYAQLAAAGVDVKGKIVLARYARSHRAVKLHTAQEAGAAGILIYSDPADDGFAKGPAWPDGPWRAEGLLQRGNGKYSWFWHGDPLTPGVAATPQAARVPLGDAPTLPRIPAAVLSWGEAAKILRALEGAEVPGFKGGLPIGYRVGPGPAAVRLSVRMENGSRTIRNVIGRLPGTRESDRYVLLGTHHDAWTFGGVDPGSSAAVLLELARALGALHRSGWQPDRSILFAFWDAEEFGLIGSTEFAEDRARELRERAVAYVNTDLYMDGRFDAGGTPSLRDFLVQVARDVPEGTTSLYHVWRAAERRRETSRPGGSAGSSRDSLPERQGTTVAPTEDRLEEERRQGEQGDEVELAALGSGADFVAFQDHLGLPTLSLEFDFEGSYGTYHSNYDTRLYFERFGDPGFRRGVTLGRVLGLVAVRLANAEVLPFRYSHYAERIATFLAQAPERAAADTATGTRALALDLTGARAEADAAAAEARQVEARIEAALRTGRGARDPRALNDALARLEQALLDESEPPDRRWYRHVVYGWNIYSLYDGQPLPGLAEAIRRADDGAAAKERARIEAALKRMRAGLAAASEAAGEATPDRTSDAPSLRTR
jgi:N-acetylated-alpha-linked acidic dipeptidase